MWKLQQIQAVWFVTSLSVPPAEKLFTSSLGQEPESVQSNRSLGPSNAFLSQAIGQVNNMTSTITVQPGRVALAITPIQQEIDMSQPFLSIDQATALAMYSRATQVVSNLLQGVVRTATVAAFTSPAKDYADAARAIFSATRTDLPTDGLSDVEFQLNKRMVGPEAITVNRLLKFNVLGIEILMGTHPGQAVPQNTIVTNLNATTLAIDINNVPDKGILSDDTQIALFDAYIDEMLNVIDSGSPIQSLWDRQ